MQLILDSLKWTDVSIHVRTVKAVGLLDVEYGDRGWALLSFHVPKNMIAIQTTPHSHRIRKSTPCSVCCPIFANSKVLLIFFFVKGKKQLAKIRFAVLHAESIKIVREL